MLEMIVIKTESDVQAIITQMINSLNSTHPLYGKIHSNTLQDEHSAQTSP